MLGRRCITDLLQQAWPEVPGGEFWRGTAGGQVLSRQAAGGDAVHIRLLRGVKEMNSAPVLYAAILLLLKVIVQVDFFLFIFFKKDMHLEPCLLEKMPKLGGNFLESLLLPVHLT